MKPIPFLTEEEIQKLQEAEANSSKEQKKTAEQIEAIYTSGQNILVSASAGSGKTFVMAERILDQLARGIEISQLFISTFTVKAATELKERLEKKISQQIQETHNVDLKQHLGRQLADLPNAAIGTMDSFTQKFLGKHGYLLDIAPNFRILQNQSEQLLLKNEVFHEVFEAHYQGKQKETFSHLLKNFAGRGKDERGLRQQVYKIYDFLQSTSNPQKWLRESFLEGFEKADFTSEKDKLTQQIQQTLWDLESFFRYHLDNDAKEFPKAAYLENVQLILDEIGSLNQESDSQAYQAVLARVVAISKEKNGRALTNASRKADLKPLVDAYNEERKTQFAKLGQLSDQITILDYQERYHGDTWELAKTFQAFMSDFVEAYRQRKRQENAFEFADISHYTIEILENFPQVRQDYQERFHEVMVDEYQDTNHIQERMLELLSNGYNRFMVGDIKQSIYRFRQADPQIFNEKFQRYAQNPEEGKLILLKENFRSSSEVLSVTNDVFECLMDQEVGEINYDSMHQLVFANTKLTPNPDNKAEFLLYDKDDTGEEDESQTETKLTGEMRLVIKEILKLHQEQGVAFKEIALLTSSRSRNDQILLALSEYGIPVKTDGEQNNYLQSLEVQVMLDTLRVIHNPLQDYALVALMKSPMFGFDEDELARLSLQKAEDKVQENLYEKLVNAQKQPTSQKELIHSTLAEKLKQFMDILVSWRLYAKTHSLYDLIWKIYNDRFYYDYVGALPNGLARQANLYALALRADQFEKSNFKGLSRFIRMIDQVLEAQHDLASVAVAPPKDAVELMTIHKSKGLEFPYVFILNMDQDFNKQDSMSEVILSRKNGLGVKYIAKMETGAVEAHYPKTIKLSIPSLTYRQNEEELQLASYSEQMRLLYVAMTRAEKKIYLVGKGSREKLESKEYPATKNGKLNSNTRLQARNFQDWIWAISKVFAKDHLNFSYRFVGEDQLTREAIGELENKSPLQDSSQADNRQSETIKEALEMLKEVEVYNTLHRAAIELPSVQTPSQIKKFYEPVMDMEGVEIAGQGQSVDKKISFELPDFSTKEKVTGAEIGSATHELMQRIDLSQRPTLASLTETLKHVQTSPAVRDKINLAKILAFFDTALGQEILSNTNHLYREQPFSMLKRDQKSLEDFVVRGILDGYLLYEDRIVLFDYKTDRYDEPSQLIDRYRGQLALYEADTWEQATKEWNEVSLIFNGIGRSNCVCGNAIKYAYELFNGVTGQRLFPIGSDCVRHFHRLSLDQQLEEEEKLLRKVENLTRKAQKKEKIKVNKSDFDERLLKWLWEKGVFKPNRGNQFTPEKDYQLFLEVFQGSSWTKAEPKKKARMEEVLEKCIKPFLLGKPDDQLYLVKLGKEKIDYEQELRIQAEKERKKRDKIAKQYADNLVLAMGPAERAYQDYFGFTETLTQEERKWEKILFGKNRTERVIKAKQFQKELEKDKLIASQDPIERKQKQNWLLNSYFRELPEEKARFSRLLLEYRKSGEVPFSSEYLSDHLIDFFYKMKAFEFEISPEQVRDFLKESLQTDILSSAQESWIEGILTNCIVPFLSRILI